MKFRLIVALTTLLLIIIACGNTKKLKESTSNNKTQITKTITGRGSETQRITLNEGAAIFKFNYTGTGNFIVWLKDNKAKEIELIANEVGSTSGSKSANIEIDGTYIIDVQAEGSWTLDIK